MTVVKQEVLILLNRGMNIFLYIAFVREKSIACHTLRENQGQNLSKL